MCDESNVITIRCEATNQCGNVCEGDSQPAMVCGLYNGCDKRGMHTE